MEPCSFEHPTEEEVLNLATSMTSSSLRERASHLWLSPVELLLQGSEGGAVLLLTPAELLLEKGQKDLEDIGSLQVEVTLLSLVSCEGEESLENFLDLNISLSLVEHFVTDDDGNEVDFDVIDNVGGRDIDDGGDGNDGDDTNDDDGGGGRGDGGDDGDDGNDNACRTRASE